MSANSSARVARCHELEQGLSWNLYEVADADDWRRPLVCTDELISEGAANAEQSGGLPDIQYSGQVDATRVVFRAFAVRFDRGLWSSSRLSHFCGSHRLG